MDYSLDDKGINEDRYDTPSDEQLSGNLLFSCINEILNTTGLEPLQDTEVEIAEIPEEYGPDYTIINAPIKIFEGQKITLDTTNLPDVWKQHISSISVTNMGGYTQVERTEVTANKTQYNHVVVTISSKTGEVMTFPVDLCIGDTFGIGEPFGHKELFKINCFQIIGQYSDFIEIGPRSLYKKAEIREN